MLLRKKHLYYMLCLLSFFPAKGQYIELKLHPSSKVDCHIIDSLAIQTQFDTYKDLKNTLNSFRSTVYRLGFIDATIGNPFRKNDSTYTASVALKKRYIRIKIFLDSGLTSNQLKKIGYVYNKESSSLIVPFTEIETFLLRLNKQNAKNGRAFSSVRLTQIKKQKDNSLSARLKAVASKQRQINHIIIKGYEKFPRAFMRYYIGLKKGELFNKDELNKKLTALNNLRFANSIKAPEVQFTKDSTSIYLYLEKEKSNTFEGFLGFSNNENNDFQLQGNIDLLLYNNLNYGESLRLSYIKNPDAQTQFQAEITLPYIFSSPIGLNLGLHLFKMDSTYITVGQEIRFTFQVNPKLNTFLGYQHTTSNNTLNDSLHNTVENIQDFRSDYLSLGGAFTDYNANNFLFPIKTQFLLSLHYGERQQKGLTENQWKISEEIRYQWRLNQRNRIFIHNYSAVLFSSSYLTNELFRFGGIRSVRGFSENSISANLFTATQTEYRYRLSQNLYVHTIVDYAYFENRLTDTQSNLYGLGFGFGLRTKAGRLQLNFANGKTDRQNFKFSNTKVHISLTSHF